MADHAGSSARRSRGPQHSRAPVLRAGRRLVGALVSVVLLSGLLVSSAFCWGSAAETTQQSAADLQPVPRLLPEGPLPPPVPPVQAVDAAAVGAGIDAAASRVGASVNAVVLDRWGRTLVQTSGAERPVLAASLVKLFVVQRLLDRAGPAGWSAATLHRMERAITISDDAAMSALWSVYDGAALVQDAVAAFGLTGTAPPAEPGQWGEATTSARDVARFLSALAAAPQAWDSSTLLGWMRATAPTAADGFDQTFGLFPEAGAAVKQGWMCCVDRRRQLHSAGVLADGRVVVVTAEVAVATSWDAAVAAVDGATEALLLGTR
jgi:hypothetical protein